MKRTFTLLALFACLVLSFAAVWMGGLNQDEGWYLYAANLVAEGKIPYRDFFFTQGPILPIVYSAFSGVWKAWGLLGARVFTLGLGVLGIAFAVALARRLAPKEKRSEAMIVTLFLLGANLYHLYYLAIPKTYALAGLFVLIGLFLVTLTEISTAWRRVCLVVGGFALAFAAGTRISLGAILCVVGLWLLFSRRFWDLVAFSAGGLLGLGVVYGPFLVDPSARLGFIAAQAYHAARGGFDLTWTIGSLSRLVRWYLPVFLVFGLACRPSAFRGVGALPFWAFLAVFTVQILAPFPYEDYQIPVMALLAVFAAVHFVSAPSAETRNTCRRLLLVLGLSFANSFGSPLLEAWSTNGQDRFWSLKKESSELAQLRKVARQIETLDPGGKTLFTQDLYLAIETNRKVPHGLEMGPFAVLSDAQWRQLIASAPCPVAALSGYTFAIDPPSCVERPMETQMAYWELIRKNYNLIRTEEFFGQNATPLLLLKRK